MRTTVRRWTMLTVVSAMLIGVLLGACVGGVGGGGNAARDGQPAPGATNEGASPADSVGAPVPEQGKDTASRAAGGSNSAPAAPGGAPGQTGAQQGSDVGRLVVQSATMSLKVENVTTSVGRVQQLASSLGGSVQASTTRQQDQLLLADVTIVVPSNRFTDALAALRGLSEQVVSESAQGQDVTEEYVDLQSRQRNLEATEKSLLTLMSKAATVGEVLNVQRELTKVQGELEQVLGRLKYLKTKADMSSITVQMQPVVVPPPPAAVPGWDPLRVAEEAWNASLRVLQGVASAAITMAVFLWWILPPALLALYFSRRYLRRRTGSTTPSAATQGGPTVP